MTTETPSTRSIDLQAALRLTYLTLGWVVIEGTSALWLGTVSKSLLLEGFGGNSLIELFSAGVLLWRLQVEAAGKASLARVETVERRAAGLVGYTLYGLAALITVNSLLGLSVLQRVTDTQDSVWGILIGLTAKIGMPVLAGYKLKVAARLGSKALWADAMEAITCGTLSVVLMVGLAVTRLLPSLWWLDSVAALALIPWLIKEGHEAITDECGCGARQAN